MLFENKYLKIYNKEVDDNKDLYDFSVEIKEFDTPNINMKYDICKERIVSMWIDRDEDENEPKNHVAYKIIDLCRYELCDIFKFMIKHK